MQTQRPAAPEQRAGERRLHQRFAAGDGDAASQAQKAGQRFDLGHGLVDRDRPAVMQLPGVRVMTVQAAELAAGQEEDQPDARPVSRRATLYRMQVATVAHIAPWKVRLITSSCCSRVSLMKFTA